MRFSSLALLVVLSFSSTGCKSLAQKIEKQLGVPVQVSSEYDSCVDSQLYVLIQDFKSLSKDEQAKTAEAFREKFKMIVVQPTRVSQVIRGTEILLHYRGDSYSIAKKVIEDGRTYEGTAPVTQVSKANQILTITAESTRDEAVAWNYGTHRVTVYDEIDESSNPLFLSARQDGSVYLISENAGVGISCGQAVRLADLLN